MRCRNNECFKRAVSPEGHRPRRRTRSRPRRDVKDEYDHEDEDDRNDSTSFNFPKIYLFWAHDAIGGFATGVGIPGGRKKVP